jgi:hypothetical protein
MQGSNFPNTLIFIELEKSDRVWRSISFLLRLLELVANQLAKLPACQCAGYFKVIVNTFGSAPRIICWITQAAQTRAAATSTLSGRLLDLILKIPKTPLALALCLDTLSRKSGLTATIVVTSSVCRAHPSQRWLGVTPYCQTTVISRTSISGPVDVLGSNLGRCNRQHLNESPSKDLDAMAINIMSGLNA